MRITTRIVQAIVALLFIVSGLVKANDPLGLAYKMEEFFELWMDGLKSGHFFAKTPLISLLDFLNHHTLFLAITMITLEIIAGVTLLLGWMKKFILYLLLVLIIFFSFLTGYAYLSGKFTNCGRFSSLRAAIYTTGFFKKNKICNRFRFIVAYSSASVVCIEIPSVGGLSSYEKRKQSQC